uniref:Uncharacterized protein n=1 Tax=Clandestinovirus TaxID=2831644 RepID=A0A8F8PN86_9VIRU|nr:hypothetical protein KOM_12_308 [Clandestinovirus]
MSNTIFDFTSGYKSFPPGPESIRSQVGGCPSISYIYEQDGMLQPSAYWVCVAFADASYEDVTMMSGIRKHHALRPFTFANIQYNLSADMAAKLNGKQVQPVVYISTEGSYWFKIVVSEWKVIGSTLSILAKCDEKLVNAAFPYKGHNFYSQNGLTPMVMEYCGGAGYGAFSSYDDNDGNPIGVHYTDPQYVWKIPSQH